MFLTKNIQEYICFSEASLSDALAKMNENKARLVFIVTEHGKLLGSLSDGDVRRWLTQSNKIDLTVQVKEVMNCNVKAVNFNTAKSIIEDKFINGVDCIPLVDDAQHLIQLAFQKQDGFFVGDREISETSPSFIIAEIGNNHQGDINLAKELVDHAVNANVDCVKFQMRSMKQLYKSEGENDDSADLGAQYTLDLLSRFQLKNEELIEVFDYAKSKGILPLCTPWDLDSLKELEAYGMLAYKVASADFTNFELLEAVANTGKPFFCSTGMSSEAEIKETVNFLNNLGANYVLLHCNSTYPTPFKDVNLKYLNRLRKITGQLVGYSGHERGICVPVASITLGACVIEKHLTVDQTLEGTDHKVSLLPNELKEMVTQIRNVEEALGSDEAPREITQGELINRENLAKSLVAKEGIEKGTLITRDLVEIKSPGQGLQPNRLEDLVGTVANRDIEAGSFFYMTDITGQIEKRNYSFNRPFGVPVRYHDYRAIKEGTNLDFVEFHLSYQDLEVDLKKYFSGPEDIGFAVHSPELFANDHILDLCSDNLEYRAQSIDLLTRVVEITKKLNTYFPKTTDPVIVVNAGGWNHNGFIDESLKQAKYNLIADALNQIDLTGVTIAIQTMPPFPWHFGGQSYHNLFVDADEIVDFCQNNQKIKVCYDVSHTMMSCNYYGWELSEFTKKIGKYTVHMHIVDALGIDGEGIEIGKGDVDFSKLAEDLEEVAFGCQFIPEVWQGHKNKGEGFWKALQFLENYFRT
ncbi:N-acetylneuraminate synthase family protein [Pseudoalteromonas sp. SG43-5]|uniref:N-acetylneuraminate synthase family protein n=1 Tax=Pseudoalteromonas sp. SG43-5 TaxID=2760968 RepID=UPI001600234C|nr:N-acetylneuraminate synthase family protein [Pseudoalteromonas sp. SG43-5]MBB1456678.1 N-acetylneuraminate synthase family protein [Pseudoalteromonas sp. SG43-5]